jgi:ABC-type glycerol-3-phosphate transport system substrate-binding protein
MRLLFTLSLLLGLSGAGCRLERPAARARITLEVAIFEGGYGVEWYRQVAREYERQHPDIEVNLWGDPRVDEKLKPRVLRGNPPDVANALLPVWRLLLAGKLYPLDAALDSPAYDQPGTWRQSLVPGVLASYQYQGKTYAMPTDFGAWVVWYDRRLFRKHGWTPPRTWNEFRELCHKIKATGVSPIAFQGKYPIYAWATLLTLYQRITTPERWYALQDLTPGAFRDPDFVRAAALLQGMTTAFHQPGANAMTHTESQLEWVNQRAALVFCGLWLYNEMKQAIPTGFEMDCFPVPAVEGGMGDPRAVYGGGGAHYFVFAQGKHPREGADFLKFMVSKERARSFSRSLGALSPVRGATQGFPLPASLQSAARIVENAPSVFADRLAGIYPELATSILPENLSALMRNEITPEAFSQRLEAAAEAIRRNPDLYKPPALGVPKG